MTALEKLYSGFSDDFKGIYGVRPRFAMTEEQILKWYDRHIDWDARQEDMDAWRDAEATGDFSKIRNQFESDLTIEVDGLVNLGELLKGAA